jgi:hypothetical protein
VVTWVDALTTGGGGERRNMAECFVSPWEEHKYIACYPTQQVMDKLGSGASVMAQFKRDGNVIKGFRYRKVRSGEPGSIRVRDYREDQRPFFTIPNLVSYEGISERTRVTEKINGTWIEVDLP